MADWYVTGQGEQGEDVPTSLCPESPENLLSPPAWLGVTPSPFYPSSPSPFPTYLLTLPLLPIFFHLKLVIGDALAFSQCLNVLLLILR